jgi:hypothetical protein
MLSELQQLSGQHLVLVRYGPDHSPHEEWVFNDADIDASKVIWARDLSGQPVERRPLGAGLHAPPNESRDPNQALIDYFSDRSVWLLNADEKPAVLHLTSEIRPGFARIPTVTYGCVASSLPIFTD